MYKPSSYKVGSKLGINKYLFKGAHSKSHESEKLGAKRFEKCEVTNLIRKNTVILDLLDHLEIHLVIHVSHTTP